jgi:hypothetical protein
MLDNPSPNGVPRDGHDPVTGRFAPGNRVAKGNSIARRMHDLRQTILDATTAEQVAEVWDAVRKLALGGDVSAARLYIEQTIGQPAKAIELSGPDGAALDLPSVVTTIMIALGDEPEARIKVAAAFHQLGRARDELPRLGSGA